MSRPLRDLLTWLNDRFASGSDRIRPGTRLFAEGWIGSMGILQLIAWVEQHAGREIPDRLIRVDYWETPTMIVDRFLTAREEVER